MRRSTDMIAETVPPASSSHAWGLKDACASFMSRCQALNLAGGTLTWYRHILGDLAAFFAGKDVHDLDAVEPFHLRGFLVSRREKGHSSQTVDRTYGAVRCAFRFWNREGMLARNPMTLVDRPRRERNLIRPFSAEQATQLISQPDGQTFEGLRDRAMIMIMLDSGLRVSEVRTLEADRIDWMSCTMTVMGKGRKERSVPFSAKTCQALREYSRLRSQKGVRSPQFFVGRTLHALERTKARRIILRYGRKAGIEGVRISPHTLRHTSAVFYIRNGGDSFSLQEILGHSSLEMTRHYVNLARRDVAEQHKKFSPMEALLGRPVPAARPRHAEFVAA